MLAKQLLGHQPKLSRQTRLMLLFEVLLHLALAEIIRFVLHHLIRAFPYHYWIVLIIPLAYAILFDKGYRIDDKSFWAVKKSGVYDCPFGSKTHANTFVSQGVAILIKDMMIAQLPKSENKLSV